MAQPKFYRFRNALEGLQQAEDGLYEFRMFGGESLSLEESRAREALINKCHQIAKDFAPQNYNLS